MMEPGFSDTAEKISQDVADYVNMKVASAKLAAVEGLSKLFGNALRVFILIMMCVLALMAFFVAAIISLGIWIDSFVWAALIVGAACLIIGFSLYYARKFFINPMVRLFSDMMFSPGKEDDDER